MTAPIPAVVPDDVRKLAEAALDDDRSIIHWYAGREVVASLESSIARAILADRATRSASSDVSEVSECQFVADWYRPSRCLNCGGKREAHSRTAPPAPEDRASARAEVAWCPMGIGCEHICFVEANGQPECDRRDPALLLAPDAEKDEIARLTRDADRSEKHRNDLSDRIVSLRTELAAERHHRATAEARATELDGQVAALVEALGKARTALAGYTSAENAAFAIDVVLGSLDLSAKGDV